MQKRCGCFFLLFPSFFSFTVSWHRDLFNKHGLILSTAWTSNDIHYKVWNEITYLFSNFYSSTVGNLGKEAWFYLWHNCYGHVITDPLWDESETTLAKWDLRPFRRCMYHRPHKKLTTHSIDRRNYRWCLFIACRCTCIGTVKLQIFYWSWGAFQKRVWALKSKSS